MADAPKRREIQFDTIDQALADAEQLASGEVETTGHYSYGQILEHLARTMDMVTGHSSGPPVSLPMKIMGRVMRPFLLSRPMQPGFKLPGKAQSVFWPSEDVTVQDGLTHFKEAVERFRKTDPLAKHAFFGNMTREQHNKLQCLHTAMHLSFVHPATSLFENCDRSEEQRQAR